MFEKVTAAPPDAILGLTETFKKDPRPGKVNLSVGVFKDDQGRTPVLKCVKEAERRLLEGEATKTYLSIEGSPEYGRAVRELMFGADHEIVKSGRACTAQCPGGTGALRVAADFLKKLFPSATVWFSAPTWPNHQGIFKSAGLNVASYPYFDAAKNSLDFDGLLSALKTVAAGDVVCLHGCCHNPSGVDPTPAQWTQIADVLAERGALPLLDFAYQGFGRGLQEDAAGLLALARSGAELLVASSFSKNFGLYNERVGALTLVAKDAAAAETALSQIKTCVRTNYSNPPSHGGAIVAAVLADPAAATAVGRRTRRDARPHQRHEIALSEDDVQPEHRPRLVLHHPTNRHVFVLWPEARASRCPPREARDLFRARRPHQRCRHERRLDGSPLRRHRVGLVIP